MDNLKYYILFNPELKNCNIQDIKKNYMNDINNNEKLTSFDSFFKRYPEFNIENYKKFNRNLQHYPMIDILVHMHLYGYNKLIYSEKTFYEKYPNFDINEYKITNPQLLNISIIDILAEYHHNIINLKDLNNINCEKNNIIYPIINLSNFKQSINNPLINKQIECTDNDIIENKEFKSKSIKLAHIFVHFFKVGGGEAYLSNFNKYNSIFEETLLINKNYPNETLFKYKGKKIFYNNYKELNKILIDYDIIIDHQLYWFDIKVTLESFFEIPQNKIIRIIHGVPIHFKDITEYNFYYSIELYNEQHSDISWNNHIKIYNNIGVRNNNIIEKKLDNTCPINILILGRIDDNKVPIKFLKNLIMFANIYNNYKFNFYGVIDDKYSKSFMNIISKNNNILYNGVIDPECIDQVYLNNDILLHPSKLEAGATVVLEAMSFGLPVICRNIGGLPNAVGINNYKFLFNTENEIFEKLLLINDQNYTDISKNNTLKVLAENNQSQLMIRLIDQIKDIYDYESNLHQIPNIIHYIFGLEKQKEEFPFVYYLSIYSNHLINKPITIYFHYQYLPYGYWWDKAKKYLQLNYINANNLYWGTKKITKFAHKADKIRLDMLYKYGGIYMDIDTITYKPYHFLLDYDFVIGIQEDNYGKNNRTLYCNAIILSKKNNIFIKKWMEEYEKHFNPIGWCEASVHLPNIIYNNLTIYEKNRMKVLDKECFYYPLYTNVDKIFEDNEDINDKLITLHLWNTYSNKYYKDIQDFNWADTNNSLYSKLIKNISNYTL